MNRIEIMLLRISPIRVVPSLLLVLTAVVVTFFFNHSSTASGQESSVPIYRSTTSEVRLVFFATDKNNHPIQELQAEDFVVVDNEKVVRDFLTFTRVGVIDLDVVVLMDFSESVLPHLQKEITDVLQLISLWPWKAGDRLSVLSFSGMEERLVCSENCRSLNQMQLASLPSGGTTPLFDALEMAADLILQRRKPDVWPVIIIFSDGNDTVSKASLLTVWEKLLISGAQIYSIDIGARGQPSDGQTVLQRLADGFGGRLVPISDGARAIVNYEIDDLRSARMVTYAPPLSASDFHSIRILPTHSQKWKFRSRCGYYRPSDAP